MLLNPYRKINVDHHTVTTIADTEARGVLQMRDEEYPVLNSVYAYDPYQDKERPANSIQEDGRINPWITRGVGVVHPEDENFCIKGTLLNYSSSQQESCYSLYHFIDKRSSAHQGDSVSEKYTFRFGLLGAHAGWNDKVFKAAQFSFDNLVVDGSYFEMAEELLDRSFKEDNPRRYAMFMQEKEICKFSVSEGVTVTLTLSLAQSSSEMQGILLQITPLLRFFIESEDDSLSVKDIWEDYIVPIQSLLSISLGEKILPDEVTLYQSTKGSHLNSSRLVSAEIVEGRRNRQLGYFDPAVLTAKNYSDWISGFSEIKHFSELLILSNESDTEFKSDADFLILSRLIVQLEPFFQKVTEGECDLPTEFGKQVAFLIDRKWKNNGSVLGKNAAKKFSTRILDMRTLLAHNSIEHVSVQGRIESKSIFELVKLVYLNALMSKFAIKLPDIQKDQKHSFAIMIAAKYIALGYGQWEILNQIREKSIARANGVREGQKG